MSETKPTGESESRRHESGDHYEASRELAVKAVAEIREYCNDPKAYRETHNCDVKVSLKEGHPVAIAVNGWYESLDGTLSIDEDLKEWLTSGCSRLNSDYVRVLELWHEFTTQTSGGGDIPFARESGVELAGYIESLYASGMPEARKPVASSPSGFVKLYGVDQRPEVNGKRKIVFKNPDHYAIVEALLKNSDGMTNRQLNFATKYSDPRVVLIRLMEEEDWERVIKKVEVDGKKPVLWAIE